MRLPFAVIGSVAHFLAAPVVVAGVIPYWITAWRLEQSRPLAILGGSMLIVAGTVVLIACFWLFVRDGRGTPAPMAPTETLVARGPYRFVRNPMYLSVAAIIAGQSLLFGNVGVLVYGAVATGLMAAFTHGYEEPMLRAAFGAQYVTYSRHVSAWLPRLRPWRGTGSEADVR